MLLKGVGASSGAAIASIFYVRKPDLSVERQEGRDPKTERERYENAKERAFSELDELFVKAAATDAAKETAAKKAADMYGHAFLNHCGRLGGGDNRFLYQLRSPS